MNQSILEVQVRSYYSPSTLHTSQVSLCVGTFEVAHFPALYVDVTCVQAPRLSQINSTEKAASTTS